MIGALDLVIRNGLVVDGTGSVPRVQDVAIQRGHFVAPATGRAADELDASGCVVAPGFIDIHSNLAWGLFLDADCGIATYQGVTTAVIGNCGSSLFPAIGAAREWIRSAGAAYGIDEVDWSDLRGLARVVGPLAIGVVALVGHGTARAAVLGFERAGASRTEVRRIASLVEASLKDGAFGVSFGLTYPPGAFAGSAELREVCRAVAGASAVGCFHVRIESDGLLEAVDEVIDLAQGTDARCVICHHKALGRANWGRTAATVPRVEHAENAEIYFDLYPYTTSMRNLAMLLPDAAHEGGRRQLVARLHDVTHRAELADALRANIERWDARWSDTRVMSAPETPEIESRRASDVVDESGEEGLLLALAKNQGRILTLYEGAADEDLDRVVSSSRAMVGSDGDAQTLAHRGHPRSFVTFPRFLVEFVERRRLLTLEEAIRRMTSLPASVLRLRDRGLIRPGLRADACVFNIADASRFADLDAAPHRPWPRHLLVAGEAVVRDGTGTGLRPAGFVLRDIDPAS